MNINNSNNLHDLIEDVKNTEDESKQLKKLTEIKHQLQSKTGIESSYKPANSMNSNSTDQIIYKVIKILYSILIYLILIDLV